MTVDQKKDDAIEAIENYCLDNRSPLLRLEFAEGDAYLGRYDNGEWEDNGEWNPGADTRNLPGYEEWYEIAIHVEEILSTGPNKDPRFEYIIISCKHMPVRVTAGDTVLYEDSAVTEPPSPRIQVKYDRPH